MNIKSKYKDYYDYLVGIYGTDPKLLLDRRDYKGEPHGKIIVLYICGYKYVGFFHEGKVYWGEQLRQFSNTPDDLESTYVYISYWEIEPGFMSKLKQYHSRIEIFPELDKNDYNWDSNIPILLSASGGSNPGNLNMGKDKYSPLSFYKWPKLETLNFGSIIDPESMFQMLTDWLSAKIDDKLILKDNLTDVQKLTNKGFDKKFSFRPNMKQNK